MLKFIDENDFFLVEEYTEVEPGVINWRYQNSVGFIKQGMKRQKEIIAGYIDVDGQACPPETEGAQPVIECEELDIWQRLLDVAAANNINLNRLTASDIAALDQEAVSASFKATRQQQLNSATVTVSTHTFDADEQSISRMANAILAASGEADTYELQWSLANTGTGVMTTITLGDLKEAHRLAVLNMASIWSIS